ncbi:MAG TPA: N-acetylmuramoyl-L-alanine amidase [Spirochaetia bacterium]|nr:N-acetylmuramoyl-L-alanine amidase [Spirochaetia bacterium]
MRPALALLIAMIAGPQSLSAAESVTAVDVSQNQLSIEVSGKPSLTTDSYGQPGAYVCVISLVNSVLVGPPRHFAPATNQSVRVDVTQYGLNPDVVHVVVRGPERISPPVQVVPAADGRYELRLSLMKRPPLKVFLDVGHGGYDPGGTGPDGLPESFVNLAVAKNLEQILARHGIEVELDRSNDRYVSLPERVALADESGADLFLGLYCNASSDRSIHGTTTYYYHPSSYGFARYLEDHVAPGIGLANNGVIKDNLYVIRNTTPSIPDVLIEYGYISNLHEEHLLATPDFRDRIAAALANAVLGYFGRSPAGGEATPASTGSGPVQFVPTGSVAQSTGPAEITSVVTTNGTVQIISNGPESAESFVLARDGATYFVVNLRGAVLLGGGKSFDVGPPFSGRVTIDQFSARPDIVRVAVREDYQNVYQIESSRRAGNQFITTIYPMSN